MSTNKRKTPANAQKQAQEPVKDLPGIPEGEPGETTAGATGLQPAGKYEVQDELIRRHPRVISAGDVTSYLRALLDEAVTIRMYLERMGVHHGR